MRPTVMTNLLAISRFAHVTSRLTTGKRGQFVRIPYHGRNDYPQSILLSLFSVLTAWLSLYWSTGTSREITPCYSLQKFKFSITYFSVFVKRVGRNSSTASIGGGFLANLVESVRHFLWLANFTFSEKFRQLLLSILYHHTAHALFRFLSPD